MDSADPFDILQGSDTPAISDQLVPNHLPPPSVTSTPPPPPPVIMSQNPNPFFYPAVDNFSGVTQGQSAARWIRSIELHPFPDASSLLAFIDTKLIGPAADWADENLEVRSLLDKDNATNEDKATFKQRFLSRWHASTSNFTDNTPLSQGPNESLMDFYLRVLSRLQQVGGTDELTSISTGSSRANSFILQQHLNMFISGLRDSRLGFELGKKGPITLEDACKHALVMQSWFEQADLDPRYRGYQSALSQGYADANYQRDLQDNNRQPDRQFHQTQPDSGFTYPSYSTPPVPVASSAPAYPSYSTPPVPVAPSATTLLAPQFSAPSTVSLSGQDARVQPAPPRSSAAPPRNSAYKKEFVICYKCGQMGHYKSECFVPNPPPYEEVSRIVAQFNEGLEERKAAFFDRLDKQRRGSLATSAYSQIPPTPSMTPAPSLQVRQTAVSFQEPVIDTPAADDNFFTHDPLKSFNSRMVSVHFSPSVSDPESAADDDFFEFDPLFCPTANSRMTSSQKGKHPRRSNSDEGSSSASKPPKKKVALQAPAPSHVLSPTVEEVVEEDVSELPVPEPRPPTPPKPVEKEIAATGVQSNKPKVQPDPDNKPKVQLDPEITEIPKVGKHKHTRKSALATIKGMMGKDKIDMGEVLMTSNITIPMLQFLQASPHARKEVSSLLSVPRGRKSARELFQGYTAGMVVVHDPAYRATTTPYGSFYHETFFRSATGRWERFKRVVSDYGSDVNLIIPKTLRLLGVRSYTTKGTRHHKYSYKPVSGSAVELVQVVNLQISIGGIETTTQFFVIPERVAGSCNYSALLGLPHGYYVKGIFNCFDMTITMTDPISERKSVLQGPPYRPQDPLPLEELHLADDSSDVESYYDEEYDDVAYDSADDDSSDEAPQSFQTRLCTLYDDQPPIFHDVEYFPLSSYATRFPDSEWGRIASTLSEFDWTWTDQDDGSSSPCELGFMVRSTELLEDDALVQSPAGLRMHQDQAFPTARRVQRRFEEDHIFPDEHILLKWKEEVGLQIGEDIMSDDHWRLKVLKLCYMWRDIGAQGLADMEVTDLILVQPWFKGEPIPYACKVNKRLTPEAEKFFMQTVREGLTTGKYVRVFSQWNAPTVIAYKPAVSSMSHDELVHLVKTNPSKVFRLTHNYRFLNKQVSHPEAHLELASRVTDVLSCPVFVIYMSMDLKNCFWGYGIDPLYYHYFAITAPDGVQYAPTVMPQGFSPAPFIAAAGVQIAFGPIPEPNPEPPLIGDNFRMFQDDGAAAFESKEKLFDFLHDHLFPRIKWARFNLAWDKVKLFVTKVKHLGLVFEAGGKITIDPARTEKIIDYPTPQNASNVRSFVQACQITRPHIRNFSEMARPLTRLTGTKVPFVWRDNVEEESFRMIKTAVKEALERYGFDAEKDVICECDGSGYAGGGVIKQVGPDGKERVILYDSFMLSPAERRYGTYKRELCVTIHMLDKWRCYLGGVRPTIIRTDQRPLLGFQDSAGKGHVEGIYARWAEILERSNIVWEYIPGLKNKGADAMSRTIWPDSFLQSGDPKDLADLDNFEFSVRLAAIHDTGSGLITRDEEPVDPAMNLWDSLDKEVREDPWYRDYIRYMLFGLVPETIRDVPAKAQAFKRQTRWFCVKDGHLYRKTKTGLVRCISQFAVLDALQKCHDYDGHFAIRTTFARLGPVAWWPTRREDVRHFVASCFECMSHGPVYKFEPLHPILTQQPFDMLGMDYVGPLSSTARGNVYVFHVIDYFSRVSKAWPTKRDTEDTTIACLTEFFSYFLKPLVIYTDNGTHFGQKVTKWLLDQGVQHLYTATYSPKSAGMIEKRNGLLEERIRRSSLHQPDDWDLFIDDASRDLNNHVIDTLGFSPYQILFGIDKRVPLECFHVDIAQAILKWSNIDEYYASNLVKEAITWRDETRDITDQNNELRAMKSKELYDSKLRGPRKIYQVGDLVMLYDAAGNQSKFDICWRGPFRVVEAFNSSYKIQHLRHHTPYPGKFNADHLRLYIDRKEEWKTDDFIYKDLENMPPATLRARRRRRRVVNSAKIVDLAVDSTEDMSMDPYALGSIALSMVNDDAQQAPHPEETASEDGGLPVYGS